MSIEKINLENLKKLELFKKPFVTKMFKKNLTTLFSKNKIKFSSTTKRPKKCLKFVCWPTYDFLLQFGQEYFFNDFFKIFCSLP